jgi:hypothetical protein
MFVSSFSPTRFVLATGAIALSFAACNGQTSGPEPASGRIYGAAIAVGAGTARSYVVVEGGVPTEIGVALSEQALQNLPTEPHPHGPHASMYEYLLPLPAEASLTPYRLIELDWNPDGHEPLGIYGEAHFDVHFYTITEAERNTIDPARADYEQRAARVPTADRVPQGFIGGHDFLGVPPSAATVPLMGLHWGDPAAPELNGQPFTRTFFYGSFDGRIIFIEPMITKTFLDSRQNVSVPLAQPERHGAAGYYPTRHTIEWDAQAKEHRIALTGFTARSQ